MDRHKAKRIIAVLIGFIAIFLASACQDASETAQETLLTENTILEAFGERNISLDDTTADLNIEIFPTVWEALEEHRQSQIMGEGFYYRENENSFRFWVKNAIITVHFDEMKQEDYIQILNPMRDTVFFDLNPMQETRLLGEKGHWSAEVPFEYYAYTYKDREGEEQLAAFYQLEVSLSYQGSAENTFHELEVMYEMAKQDEHRKTSLGGTIGFAEEVLMDDGTIELNGFNRSGPEHPLHYDHTISLTDFYGGDIKIQLMPVENDNN